MAPENNETLMKQLLPNFVFAADGPKQRIDSLRRPDAFRHLLKIVESMPQGNGIREALLAQLLLLEQTLESTCGEISHDLDTKRKLAWMNQHALEQARFELSVMANALELAERELEAAKKELGE